MAEGISAFIQYAPMLLTQMIFRVCLLITLILTTGCEKINYYPDKEIAFGESLAIAHRGGGNETYRENTLEACKKALELTDGIEVDIQVSNDRTVWLSHNSMVFDCNGEQRCFIETTDKEISEIQMCNGVDISYSSLESVMKYMHENNIQKYISIDLKGWKPCHISTLDTEGNMRMEAEEVLRLADKYELSTYLIFETQVMTVLTWIKEKDPRVSVYVTSFGEFERGMLLALKNNLDGISFKSNHKDTITLDKMNLLHRKGLKLAAWNIPDSTHMNELISAQVDMVQIDL
jgi:glycerophosphoryl diester phosphodiesterase